MSSEAIEELAKQVGLMEARAGGVQDERALLRKFRETDAFKALPMPEQNALVRHELLLGELAVLMTERALLMNMRLVKLRKMAR